MKKQDRQIKLEDDVFLGAVAIPLGYAVGNLRSFIDPFALLHEIKYIREQGFYDVTSYSFHLFGAIGYGLGVNEIVKNLCDNPKNPGNYVPIITNLISAGIQIYNYGKKSQRLESQISEL